MLIPDVDFVVSDSPLFLETRSVDDKCMTRTGCVVIRDELDGLTVMIVNQLFGGLARCGTPFQPPSFLILLTRFQTRRDQFLV